MIKMKNLESIKLLLVKPPALQQTFFDNGAFLKKKCAPENEDFCIVTFNTNEMCSDITSE